MKQPLQRRRPPGGNILQGLLLIARGRPQGLECFGGTTDAFLAALSPWLAFLLVGALLMLLREPSAAGFTVYLLSFCVLLLPPVLSHAFAQRWERGTSWLRYSTAVLWCEWLVTFACAPALLMVTLLLSFGVPAWLADLAFVAMIAGYWLWLHWFLAWRGLSLDWGRAAMLVGSMVAATMVLAACAQFLPPHLGLVGAPRTDPASLK